MLRTLMRAVRTKHDAAWVRLCYCQPYGCRRGRFDVQLDWFDHHGGVTHIHGDSEPAWVLLWRVWRMPVVERGVRFHIGYPEYTDPNRNPAMPDIEADRMKATS